MKKAPFPQGQKPDDLIIHPALRVYFTYCLYKLALHMRAAINGALSAYGIVGPQIGLLRVIEVSGPLSQHELSQTTGIDVASMVAFLDGLEEQSWVKRRVDPKDRRVKLVTITPAGRRFLAKANSIRTREERKFFAPLSKEEREAFQRTLRKLLPKG